jgi:hypothetical protein
MKRKKWTLTRRDSAKHDYHGNPHWEFTAHEIKDDEGNTIISDEFGLVLNFDEQDWNMVAAAPEMLEALEKFTKIEYAISKDLTIYGNTYVPEEWFQFLSIARDIISNVKGENQ